MRGISRIIGLALLMGLLACIDDPPPTRPFVIEIVGRVTDSEGDPVAGATITTNPPSGSISTDSNGQFAVSIGVETGEYTIIAVKEGYRSASATIRAVEALQGQRADIILLKGVAPSGPKIHASPLTLDFGSEQTVRTFGISNTGTDILTWKAVRNGEWFTLSPDSGAVENGTQSVEVRVSRQGLIADSYWGTIDLVSNGGSEAVRVAMVVQTSPKLSVTPPALAFIGDVNSLNLDISNIGTGVLAWHVSKNRDWLSLSDTSGTAETETDRISVTVDRTGLPPGEHSGSVEVSSNGGIAAVSVTVAIPEPPDTSQSSSTSALPDSGSAPEPVIEPEAPLYAFEDNYIRVTVMVLTNQNHPNFTISAAVLYESSAGKEVALAFTALFSNAYLSDERGKRWYLVKTQGNYLNRYSEEVFPFNPMFATPIVSPDQIVVVGYLLQGDNITSGTTFNFFQRLEVKSAGLPSRTLQVSDIAVYGIPLSATGDFTIPTRW
jgi:hypothetical protein